LVVLVGSPSSFVVKDLETYVRQGVHATSDQYNRIPLPCKETIWHALSAVWIA
jgi:hypothetical protein